MRGEQEAPRAITTQSEIWILRVIKFNSQSEIDVR